jgi:hypothetical protein
MGKHCCIAFIILHAVHTNSNSTNISFIGMNRVNIGLFVWLQEAQEAFRMLQEDAREVTRHEQALRKKLKSVQRDLEVSQQILAKEAEKVSTSRAL